MGFSPTVSGGSTAQTAASVPTTGSYTAGQLIYNSNPNTGQPVGWVCIASGSLNSSAVTWDANQSYTTSSVITANGNIYTVSTAGKSGDVAPSGTGSSIAGTPPTNAYAWQASVGYATGQFVTPTASNGFYYEATTGNATTGSTQPTWPTTDGATVTDGGVTWTAHQLAVYEYSSTLAQFAELARTSMSLA